QIATALDQAEELGWWVEEASQALTDLLNPVLNAGYLEEWPDLDTDEVPGPRLEGDRGPIPLASVLKRLPGVVPYLPWLPGKRAQLSLYHHHERFHDIPFDEAEELQKNPVWERRLQTHDWEEATTSLMKLRGGVWERRDLSFGSYFEHYDYLGEALKAQADDD